jgi:putative mRNA 3-end processing factor
MPVLEFSPYGIYCPQGDFYIDPWKPVRTALITHAHSDHARWGNSLYLAHKHSEAALRLRLGNTISLVTVEFGQKLTKNGVEVSFHPAGHIIGSAQIRVAYRGEIWVVSGDYKTRDDGISGAFEPVIHSSLNLLSGCLYSNGNHNRKYMQLLISGGSKTATRGVLVYFAVTHSERRND